MLGHCEGKAALRLIDAETVSEAVKEAFIRANHRLQEDVCDCLKTAVGRETDPLAVSVLKNLCDNLDAANRLQIPICQDTGMAVVFADVGQQVHIQGATLEDAINVGVSRAYLQGGMRCSVVSDPLYDRKNTNDNTPAVIHIHTVPGDFLRLTVAPKGFGSENMSCLKMLTPSATDEDVIAFVVEAVRNAGSNPCPPIHVGVGIGGDFEYAAELAKRALTRSPSDKNQDERYAKLEERMLAKINALGIGPQGFGGDTTALSVKVNFAPTHIAGLPVAVNINCHVARHEEVTI